MPKSVLKEATPKSAKSKAPKSAAPKLYSNFLPLPLLLPSPAPISSSSSSSKGSKQVKHYVYCREHKSKSSKSIISTPSERNKELPDGRTVFVVNLPVDVTERELRVIFGKWGVVQDVRMNLKDGGDVLEGAVMGLEVEEDEGDDEDEDEDENEEEQVEAEDEQDGRLGATFRGDLLTKKQRRAMRKRAALVSSIPAVTALPSLSPRSIPYAQSGLGSAHIIFLDSISLSRLFASSSSPVEVPKYGSEPTGLAYYTSLHSSLRPPLDAIRAFADSSMARFDHLHSLLLSSRAKEVGAGALVDEDGFTVVVRSGKFGRAGARGDGFGKGGVGVATKGFEKTKKEGGVGAGALPNFYRFQSMDRKRQDLANLRQRFEHDRAKVEELKKSRRYKPY